MCRTIFAVIGALALALTLAACGDDDDDGASSNSATGGLEKTSLRIMVPPHATAAPIFIADAKGYFKSEGLDVTIEPPTNPAAGFPALASGRIDMITTSIQPAALAVANGQEFKLITQQSAGAPEFLGIVSNNPDIKSGADLAGKKIGVNVKGAITQISSEAALKSQGVDVSQLNWVELPTESLGPALERGDVDAVNVLEPVITELEETLGAHMVVDGLTGSFDKMPLDGYFVRTDFVKENPKTLAAFRRAYAKGVEDANADEALVRSTVARATKLPQEVVDAMALPTYVSGVDLAQVERALGALRDAGGLPEPLTAKELSAPDR